ncbi:Fe-S cluster assembly protein HesB [Nocardioides zeae]|uniref:Fe-S cluster assembly protein HesB n=1 Tax=Nocardioides imazamoxiresistens TaxID=3231893 RepID=A0ABU3PT27_9ACTN|nr:Fe-S cluster assembly protein HesB [Nocardioides zeae]MDT9592375.1 Fe-S cluster assembly protein HesB [Nocardioides zeae]
MLTLTENARTIVKDIADSRPDVAGIRIAREDAAATAEPAFALSIADAPEAGDQVVESDGAVVYLDTGAAAELDDKVLDAAVDEGGELQFALGHQG